MVWLLLDGIDRDGLAALRRVGWPVLRLGPYRAKRAYYAVLCPPDAGAASLIVNLTGARRRCVGHLRTDELLQIVERMREALERKVGLEVYFAGKWWPARLTDDGRLLARIDGQEVEVVGAVETRQRVIWD